MGRATIYALVMVLVSFATAGILVLIAWISSKAIVAGAVTTATGSSVVTSSTRFWVLTATGAFILVVWAVVNYAICQDNWRTRLRNCPPPVWAFAVLLGVTVFHWLFWAISPGAWNTWLSSQTFWPMNAAIILTVFFASQQGTAARFIGLALWVLFLVVAGIGAYGYFPWSTYWSAATVGSGLRSSSSLSRLPAEVALPIIAQCESGGRQFNKDGSVVTNDKNADGTIDRGKWQINSSHDAETKRLGIDISTEEGNEKFARILYAKNELRDWEATRHCWEPKLLALGHSPGLSPSLSTPTTDNTFVVVVRPGRPAEVVMPPNWLIVWWGKKSNFTSHAIWRGSDKVRVFTVRPGVGSADIKIHRYHDPDPNWWRRQ